MEASKTTMFVLANGHDRSNPVTRFILPPNWNPMRIHGSIARYYDQRSPLKINYSSFTFAAYLSYNESRKYSRTLAIETWRSLPKFNFVAHSTAFRSFLFFPFFLSFLITFLTSHRLPSHCCICNTIYVSYPMVITSRIESSWYGRFKYDVYQLLHDRITSIEQRVQIRSSKCTCLLGVVD